MLSSHWTRCHEFEQNSITNYFGELMGFFFKGLLVENEEGATYEGKVYNRFLKLRLLDGQVISVFDPCAISTEISVGNTYEMILLAFPAQKSILYSSDTLLLPSILETDDWYGTVIEQHWRLIKETYRFSCSYLCDGERILLMTPRGQLLMSSKEIDSPINVGGTIQWKNVRLDLCAII